MALIPQEQIKKLLNRSKNILITAPSVPSTDSIAAALGLYLALEKMGKNAKVVCSDFNLPPNHFFLPKSKEINSEITSLRKFIITVDLKNAKADELSYDIKDDKLDIFLTPKEGFFRAEDVSTSAGGFEYNLIFVLDSPDLESLGRLYENNAEFFYQTPVINIDHNPANEHFGQINFVEITATSTSELVFELIKDLKENLVDEQIATNLLAGIISKTKGFQSNTVTPRSLAIASHLITSGARREEIVNNLYRTKSIATLRLWGRVLARLKSELDNRLVWSLVPAEDFIKAEAQEEDLKGIADELIVDTPQAEVIVIFYEKEPNLVKGIIYTIRALNALDILAGYNPEGTKDFTHFTLKNKTLLEAEAEVINKIKSRLIR